MSLQDTHVLYVVAAKEFSPGKITDVSPINGGTKAKLPPFGASDLVFIRTLEDSWGPFLEAFESSFPTASCALSESTVLFVKIYGVVSGIALWEDSKDVCVGWEWGSRGGTEAGKPGIGLLLFGRGA